MSLRLGDFCSDKFAVVSGRGNPELVKKICEHLNVEPIFVKTENWPNGYPHCYIEDNVTFAGKKVIIVTNLQYRGVGSPVEELEMIFGLCAGASEIHLILTYLCGKDDITHGYKHKPNAPWISRRIVRLNPKTVSLFDPHQSSQMGYFEDINITRRFYLLRLLIDCARSMKIDQIAATDGGSTARAEKVEGFLQTKLSIIGSKKEHDHTAKDSPISNHSTQGQIMGGNIGVFDDLALSWKTMLGVVENLFKMILENSKKTGLEPAKVHAFAVHFDPTEETFDNICKALKEGWIENFTTTNSNPIPQKFLDLPGFNVIDISETLALLIEMLIMDKSTFKLFHDI